MSTVEATAIRINDRNREFLGLLVQESELPADAKYLLVSKEGSAFWYEDIPTILPDFTLNTPEIVILSTRTIIVNME